MELLANKQMALFTTGRVSSGKLRAYGPVRTLVSFMDLSTIPWNGTYELSVISGDDDMVVSSNYVVCILFDGHPYHNPRECDMIYI